MGFKGVHGRLLLINLENETFSDVNVEPRNFMRFLGGKALGFYIALKDGLIRVDPLSPDNELLFMTGPLTGWVPGGGSSVVITKSPLTGIITDPVANGLFGLSLKSSGYDGLIIKGVLANPKYLLVTDQTCDLIAAENVWGSTTSKTRAHLKESHKDVKNLSVACIGPAGENMVKFACIIAESRAFGRGGAGAVMGSKKLKAVVVGGNCQLTPFSRSSINSIIRRIYLYSKEDHKYKAYQQFGTPIIFDSLRELGAISGRNYRDNIYSDKYRLDYEVISSRYMERPNVCFKCPIRCVRRSTALGGLYKGTTTEGPDFETVWAFGPQCNNESIDTIIKADHLSDELGLDTISTGNAIGFAFECGDEKILHLRDCKSVEECIIDLIIKISSRVGLGKILAEGVSNAAEILGKKTRNFAMHVKGLETPAYDPRGFYGIALALSISSRGGCHRKAFCSAETRGTVDGRTTEGKAEIVATQEVIYALKDSLVLCKWSFAGLDMELYPESIHAVTGLMIDKKDLMNVGERAINMARIFNLTQKITCDDDFLPVRFLEQGRPKGPCKGLVVEREKLVQLRSKYYRLRGWNTDGIPKKETLERLNLREFYPYLETIT